MTLCNMTIEAGACAGMIAVDEKTIDYVQERLFAPRAELSERAVTAWQQLHSDGTGVWVS